MKNLLSGVTCLLMLIPSVPGSKASLRLLDVFELEYASDPQVSPDGQSVVYVRNSMDILTDKSRSELWLSSSDGSLHRPLTESPGSREGNCRLPRWSPSGDRLLFVSSDSGKEQLFIKWMDTGQVARIAELTRPVSGFSWSHDGKWIAFSMLVEEKQEPMVKLPDPPKGAKWAEPAKVIDRVQYRSDGKGYLPRGYWQLCVLPVEGGTPRQVTYGPYHHRETPSWDLDNKHLIFSANRRSDWELDPQNSEIYEVSLENGDCRSLTSRTGPDQSLSLSPDGKYIAYVGFDDRYQGYQVRRLYLMNRDGSGVRCLTGDLDRSVRDPSWSMDGKSILFLYSDRGNTKVARIDLEGFLRVVAADVGGTSLGRPYSSGSYSISSDGGFAYTKTRPRHPADVVFQKPDGSSKRLTFLNSDLFDHKELAGVKETWFESTYDKRRIQGWIVTPPKFDPAKKYPLILEIHGGPFANYGDRFSAEMQLYASAGFVVLYINPRGSTSYGEEFGNLIHHNYPSQDYDDLISGVNNLILSGYIDEENLFVTGGSGGGVLSSWIIGKTDRFRAAVVAKPVINWTSFALTADHSAFFVKYWFPAPPWEVPEEYFRRSPLSLVGNVNTPTMILTGEEDFRTPISESEQYYQALKLRGVDSVLVRIPGASHSISKRPSNLISKVAHVLAWFERHKSQ